ncbi:MAG: helix-turn-helix domain-containing protein [Planctomycetota bacterium]
MNKAKRDRLEAAGWKFGSAAEFLGLTAEEDAFIEIKVNLVIALRRLRARRGWTQAQVARRIRSSQSRVAKMEAGDRLVSIDLLVRTLLALGATRKDLGRIIGSRAA